MKFPTVRIVYQRPNKVLELIEQELKKFSRCETYEPRLDFFEGVYFIDSNNQQTLVRQDNYYISPEIVIKEIKQKIDNLPEGEKYYLNNYLTATDSREVEFFDILGQSYFLEDLEQLDWNKYKVEEWEVVRILDQLYCIENDKIINVGKVVFK